MDIQQTKPQQTKLLKKAFWVVLLVLVVVTVAYGTHVILLDNDNLSNSNGVVNTSKNVNVVVDSNLNITAGKKKFNSEVFGIEFEYPEEWLTITYDDLNRTTIVDFSRLSTTLNNYENLSIDEQLSHINCSADYYKECERRVSTYGVRYVWIAEETPGGLEYRAIVPTGKKILSFDFSNANNYQKKSTQYQELLLTLRTLEGGD